LTFVAINCYIIEIASVIMIHISNEVKEVISGVGENGSGKVDVGA
jgi:hypothetical protein